MKVIYKFRIGRDYDAWGKPGDASVAYSEALKAAEEIDSASSGCDMDDQFALSNVVWYLHSRRSEDYKKLGETAAGEKDATEAASAGARVLANREHGFPARIRYGPKIFRLQRRSDFRASIFRRQISSPTRSSGKLLARNQIGAATTILGCSIKTNQPDAMQAELREAG